MAIPSPLRALAATLTACCGLTAARAQIAADTTAPAGAVALPAVTVTSPATPILSISGWGDLPLVKTPLPASIYEADTLKEYGVQRLSELTRLDAAISDAYNAVGYWDSLTLRGFVIDNRFNYRRDGLPINAETSVPLDNKERIEVLKGISGMQAGTSSPGGLVNFVVKRPTDEPLRLTWLQWQSRTSLLASVDLSQRFGEQNAFGMRLNAAYEQLRPNVNDADGQRALLALAGDWRLARDTLLEAEFESSRHSQPSVPGFSLIGDRLPPPVDPRINLNNQSWSLPVVFDADTASLRFTQALSNDWSWSVQLATQQLRTDDRAAFPFGCSAEGVYDRFCSDGSFDMYDYRSENERRRTDVMQLELRGRMASGAVVHALSAGVLGARFIGSFQPYAYNLVGSGNIDGSVMLPADPTPTQQNTNRNERSTEVFVRDVMQLSERFTLWAALRRTTLNRQSVSTDGSAVTTYQQSFNTPWLAASYQLDATQMLYASWGRGAESDVVPNLSQYVNPGQALPTMLSQQFELGLKGARDGLSWSVAAFDITRPVTVDVGVCDPSVADSCTHELDGSERHTGIEAGGSVRSGGWWIGGGLQWLRARRDGSQTAAINGLRPVNVPALSLKLQANYTVPAIPTLALGGSVAAEGDRTVLPDDSTLHIPGFAVVGLNGQWVQRSANGTFTWRAGIDNLFNRRAWRESPYEYGHVYLFPQTGRTFRVSLQTAW